MRIRLTAVALVTAAAALTLGAGPAVAEPQNGVCEAGEQCLYPFPNYFGSVADLPGYVENYSGLNFIGPGLYGGYPLNDNSMSIKNRNAYFPARYCKGSLHRGPCFVLGAGYNKSDLGEFNNVLSSHLSV